MVFIIAACLLLLALLNPVLVNIISPLRSCRVETRRADCAFACSLLICLLLYVVAFVLFLPLMVPIFAIVAFGVIWELLPFAYNWFVFRFEHVCGCSFVFRFGESNRYLCGGLYFIFIKRMTLGLSRPFC